MFDAIDHVQLDQVTGGAGVGRPTGPFNPIERPGAPQLPPGSPGPTFPEPPNLPTA